MIRQHASGKNLLVLDKRNPVNKPHIEALYASGTDWIVLDRIPESAVIASWDSTFSYPNHRAVLWMDEFPYVAFAIDTKEILSDLISEVEK